MPKPEWGAKHSCSSCGTKFYDFNKTPLICPKCGTENQPLVVFKQRRPTPADPPKKPTPAKPVKAVSDDDDDDEDLEVDDDDTLLDLSLIHI